MVEQVERLRAKLQVHPLPPGQRSILDHSKVYVKHPRPDPGVSPQVAIGPRQREREGAGIKVKVWSSQFLPRTDPRATGGRSTAGIVAEAGVQEGRKRGRRNSGSGY